MLQCLVNERMSLGRSDEVRSADKIVGVGCYENREIMLLAGQSLGGTGKRIIVPQLKNMLNLELESDCKMHLQTRWFLFLGCSPNDLILNVQPIAI